MQFDHKYWMEIAISDLKCHSRESGNPDEVPISALVVKDNVLISKAVNKVESLNDCTAHAEMLAIREASEKLGNWRLNDCTLYTTLEPCAMCAGAIINSRLKKIIFGAYDLNAGACGSVINLFSDLSKENQIEMIGGILELEAGKLLKDFFLVRR